MTMTQRYSPAEIEQIKNSVDIAAIIGAHVALQKSGNEFKGRCPFHNEGTPSFYVIPRKKMFHCFGCSETGDVFTFLKKTEQLDFPAAVERLRGMPMPEPRRFVSASDAAIQNKEEVDELRKKIDLARRIWQECIPAAGTPVEKYLAARGLGDVMIPPTLAFHPQLYCSDTKTRLPGMVGAITDARQRIVGVHRTYLRPDGMGKANVPAAKKILGVHRECHVCLGLPSGGILAIAEGIETAMSVMLAKPNLSVWAAMTLGNMGAQVPRGITELILCADGDNKDPVAAERVLQKAAEMHRARGHRVKIARPDPGKDFNDMVRKN